MKIYLNKAAIIGGDKRQVYLAEILQKEGYKIMSYAVNCVHAEKTNSLKRGIKRGRHNSCACSLFKRGRDIFKREKRRFVFGKNFRIRTCGLPDICRRNSCQLFKKAEKKGIICIDYLKDCRTVMENTIAVAEGTLSEAMKRSDRNLYKSFCVVMGYGRCGSTLVSYLKRMGCYVAVYEREEALSARAALLADEVIMKDRVPLYLEQADYIFNTIPAMVLPKALLEYVPKNALILDLASSPGGVDFEAAKEKGYRLFCLGTSGNLCTKIFSTNFRRDDKKKRKKGIVVWEGEIMELKGKQIGVAITGSFCAYKNLFTELENLVLEGAKVQTIFSNSAQKIDSRFGNAEDFIKRAEEVTGKEVMKTIAQAETIGPKKLLDLLIILPCTGNTIAKLANGITDTPVLWRLRHIFEMKNRFCYPFLQMMLWE